MTDDGWMKLRDVEVIIQERLAKPDTEVTKNERDTLLKIQAILYSTEVRTAHLMRRSPADGNLNYRKVSRHHLLMNWRSMMASTRMSSWATHHSNSSMMMSLCCCLRGKGSMSMKDSLRTRKRRSRMLQDGFAVRGSSVSLACSLASVDGCGSIDNVLFSRTRGVHL